MTIIEERLIKNYTTLVAAKVMDIDDVSNQDIWLEDNSKTTLQEQVRAEIEKRKNEVLNAQQKYDI